MAMEMVRNARHMALEIVNFGSCKKTHAAYPLEGWGVGIVHEPTPQGL